MEGRLEGNIAIVTGAGSGIGKAAALLLASQGARVALLDINETNGQAAAAQIRSHGDQALFILADVTRADAVEGAVRNAAGSLGPPDILINVAGGSGRSWGDGPTAECSEEGWDKTLELNLKSVFLTCKYTLPQMLSKGRGSIVNVSSVLGLVGGDQDFATHAYAASKGGIISLTRAIATYYAPKGIRANVICPGLIATAMSQRAQANPAIRARLHDLQPLTGDFGQPEDVAQAILFLASGQAAFITGAVLTVDGGWTAR